MSSYQISPKNICVPYIIYRRQLKRLLRHTGSFVHGPVPADQALRVGRSRPADAAYVVGLKPKGEKVRGVQGMGRGTLSASYVLASPMVPKPRNQCIDYGTDSAGGWVGKPKFSTVILWPIAKAAESILSQVSCCYAHLCLMRRVTI